jgi:translation initiation factor 3 subunit I
VYLAAVSTTIEKLPTHKSHHRFSKEGDLIFSVSKDHVVCAWYSANGERFGTFKGHQGALWTVDVDPHTRLLATGGADNTLRLWEVQTGKLLKTWEYQTSIKRCEFSEDGRQLLGVTEKRSGQLSTVYVYDINPDPEAEQADEETLRIVVDDIPKVTVAGFSYLNKFIITGHEDGSVTQYDAKTGEEIHHTFPHEENMQVTDLQWSADRTYFITSSKDKTAKLQDSKTLEVLKTYVADTPLNSAAITPEPTQYVILGGGQAAMDVTTTSARQGKFEARFYHKIFEEEIGRVRGHFGPLNYVAVDPTGKCYCSGGEDGYVRVHHFDPPYFDFKFEVERERERM